MPNLFGAILTGEDVAGAMTTTIQMWLPTYLAEMERVRNELPQAFPRFRSYSAATEFDHFAEDQLPGCIVIAPGLVGEPWREGDGRIYAEWAVGVASIVSGQTRSGSMRLAQIYTGAIRALVLQHPSLGQFAEATRWIDETYDDMAVEEGRTLANGIIQFGVTVPNVVDASRGPRTIPDDPYTAPPETHTVEQVFVSVDSKE